MSGRDMRDFITKYRSNHIGKATSCDYNGDVLASRVIGSATARKPYMAMDYTAMQEQATRFKTSSKISKHKINILRTAAACSKDRNLLLERQKLWVLEYQHLMMAERRLETELEVMMASFADGTLATGPGVSILTAVPPELESCITILYDDEEKTAIEGLNKNLGKVANAAKKASELSKAALMGPGLIYIAAEFSEIVLTSPISNLHLDLFVSDTVEKVKDIAAYVQATHTTKSQRRNDSCRRGGVAQSKKTKADPEYTKKLVRIKKSLADLGADLNEQAISARQDIEQLRCRSEAVRCIGDVDVLLSRALSSSDGVPMDVALAECPDAKLWATAVDEFSHLNAALGTRLRVLRDRYRDVVESPPMGGWNDEEHTIFLLLASQYEMKSSNVGTETASSLKPLQREAFLRHVCQSIPCRTRAECISHDSWNNRQRSYHRQRIALVRALVQQREELTEDIIRSFAGAIELEKKHSEGSKKREAFTRYRIAQYEKLRVLRNTKIAKLCMEEEAAERQAIEDAQRYREEVEALRAEKEAKQAQIDQYRDRIRKEEEHKLRQQEEIRERELLQHADVMKRNEERVIYRKEKYLLHQKEMQYKLAQLEAEAQEKQIALDKLRQTVHDDLVGHVEADPERLLRNTEATQRRCEEQEIEARERQMCANESQRTKRLGKMHTYSEAQLRLDKRYRLSMALHDAGAHGQAAAAAIRMAPSFRETRKDTISSGFNSTH